MVQTHRLRGHGRQFGTLICLCSDGFNLHYVRLVFIRRMQPRILDFAHFYERKIEFNDVNLQKPNNW